MRPGELRIEEEADGERRRLSLSGELDVVTAPALAAAVQRMLDGGARSILLDLRELAFLDSTGFRAILAAKDGCHERGCELLMTRGQKPVQRVFDLSGVLKRLPFVHASDAEPDS